MSKYVKGGIFMSDNTNEGSIWFWKIFGGTILGTISLLLMGLFNSIHSSINQTKNENMVAINLLWEEAKAQKTISDSLKDRVVSMEQSSIHPKLALLETSFKGLQESVASRSEKIASIETSIDHLKEEIKSIKDDHMKLTDQLQLLRDRVLTLEQKIKSPVTSD